MSDIIDRTNKIQWQELSSVGRNDPANQRNVFGASVIVSRKGVKGYFAWWSVSSHQAFCLFLVGLLEALDISYQLLIDYPLLILTGLLRVQVSHICHSVPLQDLRLDTESI